MIRRTLTLLAATALAASLHSAHAPTAGAAACPNGAPGVVVPAGTYQLLSTKAVNVSSGAQAIPLARVNGPGGSQTTFYLYVPAYAAGIAAMQAELAIGEPGVGACLEDVPTIYLGTIAIGTSPITAPSASSGGTLLVVAPDNVSCLDIPLLDVTESTPGYDVEAHLHWCYYSVTLTPHPLV